MVSISNGVPALFAGVKTALIVYEQVEELMEYLQSKGVLSGHVKGEYI